MTPDERPKPRFEPPPWETEAFERFREQQERERAAGDLDRALQAVRGTGVQPARIDQPGSPGPSEAPVVLSDPVALPEGIAQAGARVPDARIEAMLAELRFEEAPSTKAGPTLIYSAIAFMCTTGVFMAIAAIVLFAKSRPAGGSGMVVAALASMVMLLTGAGCVAGAVALYRKHHQ